MRASPLSLPRTGPYAAWWSCWAWRTSALHGFWGVCTPTEATQVKPVMQLEQLMAWQGRLIARHRDVHHFTALGIGAA